MLHSFDDVKAKWLSLMLEKGLKLLLKFGNLSAKGLGFSIFVKIHMFFDRRVYIRKLTAFGYPKTHGVFEYEG